jgi:hypothetical protein
LKIDKSAGMRGKLFLGALILLLLNSAVLYAQPGEPCAGVDPDSTCPLDTWVIVLAFVAIVFAAIHLSRKKAAQKTKLSR